MAGLGHDDVAAALAGYFPTESFKDFYNFLGPSIRGLTPFHLNLDLAGRDRQRQSFFSAHGQAFLDRLINMFYAGKVG